MARKFKQAATIINEGKPETKKEDSLIERVNAKRIARQGIAEELAGDISVVRLNWIIPGADKEFPMNYRLHVVNKYYPHAKGGPLLVDEPRWPHQIQECEQKRAYLKRMKMRYVVITEDTTYEGALDQCQTGQPQ